MLTPSTAEDSLVSRTCAEMFECKKRLRPQCRNKHCSYATCSLSFGSMKSSGYGALPSSSYVILNQDVFIARLWETICGNCTAKYICEPET